MCRTPSCEALIEAEKMTEEETIQKLKEAIKEANDICVFSGAGISCPSGIPDFRSANGLYHGDGCGCYTPEQIISHSFFTSHPDLFYEFYKTKMVYPNAKPNEAHLYFSELQHTGKRVSVVTQNIDGLHSAAGSSEVYELHGSVKRNHCTKCGAFYDEQFITAAEGTVHCSKCGGLVKPDVVLYEEGLDDETVRGAIKAIGEAKLMIVCGTSLAVYPAASFLQFFRGETLALINKEKIGFGSEADLVINNDIVTVVRALQKS